MKRLTVLSGAGMSADSGLKTFRDAGGLWEGHDVMAVASPEGWAADPELVLDFYNKRRRQLQEAEPNAGHRALVSLEEHFHVEIITQNVDDLHERAGSARVLHLHGELFKIRSSGDPSDIREWRKDVNVGDLCDKGYQLRPHVVWFGEDVPAMIPAIELVRQSDIVLIIGTSMEVYPAAGLIYYAPPSAKVFYLDPNPRISAELVRVIDLDIIKSSAAIGVPRLVEHLIPGTPGP